MTLLELTLYFLAAAAGGAINSVAGGGTFLTFPVLIMSGMSPFSANIMSTVALWPGSVASAMAYRGQLSVESTQLRRFMATSILGSCAGTAILLLTPETMFSALVPWLMLFATLIFIFGRRVQGLLRRSSASYGMGGPPAYILQFIIAVYGGYFGAGIGILMLAMLQLMGLTHIHQMNALKTVLGSTINAVAVVIFILAGTVLWSIAPVMIAGAVVGGYAGAKIALRISPEKVRLFVSIVACMTTYYFFMREM